MMTQEHRDRMFDRINRVGWAIGDVLAYDQDRGGPLLTDEERKKIEADKVFYYKLMMSFK